MTANRRPDSSWVLTMWDVASGKVIYTLDAPGKEWFIHAAFSPDGEYLLAWGVGETYSSSKLD